MDPGTMIYNRGVLDTQLGKLTYSARQRDEQFALFFFGIDHFKNYNDRNGHVAGDELLKMLVRVCNDQIQMEDVFCRYCSRFFCLILPGRSASDAYVTAEKIRTAIEAYDFLYGEGQPLGRITISGGVATFPECGSNGTELLDAADRAYYEARNSGRNRTAMATPKERTNNRP